jgi:hypothetical protein
MRCLVPILPKHSIDPDRVTFNDEGTLDEVCSTRGAHLEYLGNNRWFLAFYHGDGTDSAFWFGSKDLKKPFWETRGDE